MDVQRFAIGQHIRVIAKDVHFHSCGTIVALSTAGGYFVRLDGLADQEHPIFFYAEEVVLASQMPPEVRQ